MDLNGEMAFTNARGEFFVRVRRPQRYALAVPVDEFLLPGRWEVVTAPSQVTAEGENQAHAVEIILRRVLQVPTAPVPAPPAAPADASPAAATSVRANDAVWQSADTLHRIGTTAATGDLPGVRVRFEHALRTASDASFSSSPSGWSSRWESSRPSLGWVTGLNWRRCSGTDPDECLAFGSPAADRTD